LARCGPQRQLSEQAPGPSGWPQEPHGPGTDGWRDAEPFTETANTENCLASRVPWHDGHSGGALPCTRVSNWWSQSPQMYSKIGMRRL